MLFSDKTVQAYVQSSPSALKTLTIIQKLTEGYKPSQVKDMTGYTLSTINRVKDTYLRGQRFQVQQ